MSSSYAFTSLSATFTILSNESISQKYGHQLGCVSAVVTPDLGNIASILKFLPLAILILTGFAVILAGTLSPWGTMDIFHWTSNYGRDADVLRLVTPGFGDCLQYIQFIAFTGALTLDYPGFFRPVVSQVGWSSLMFEESFVADAEPWKSVVDGIYVNKPNTTFGLEKLGQLVGMAEPEDIWPGMMVWLCVMIAAVTFLIQVGFAVHWIYRKIKKIPQEDLRSKNLPFVLGNVVRIVFNFMLIPIVALSSFQLVVASKSPSFAVALAALTLALMICFASWVLYMVVSTKPKLVLFDDLPTLLRYGPLYNTYSDSVAAFALIPILLNFIRGIAIGAVQPSGVVQVVLLAICEVIQLLMIYAIRPYQSATSMNIYHSAFALLRLAIIMLLIAFAPSLDVTEGSKGWIGYTILAIHAAVLIFGFFLSSFQTVIEVVARLLGAGGDDITGLTRGGLSKIFGMRQLSRRVDHRKGPSRGSQLSNAAMLDADKTGYVMPGGRVRSGSAASLGDIMAHQRHRSSSAIDSIDMYSTPYRNVDSASSYMPGTPGEASNFSFLPSHGHARYGPLALPMESADPYYRPPRRRRDTAGDITPASTQQGPAVVENAKPAEPAEATAETSQNALSNPGGSGPLFPASRPDYSTREVDFYYGVRGPALNSDGPGRKLGTGPADPTGPVATAAGWFRIFFGGKTKEKGKGFEVVRSSRMPPSMRARNGGIDSKGNPVAMSNARHGPIDSDDDEPKSKRPPRRGDDLLNTEGEPQSDPEEPDSPVVDRLPRGRLSQVQEAKLKFRVTAAQVEERQDADTIPRSSSDEVFHDAPEVPRKSSKRQSVIESHKSMSLLETQSHPPGSRDSHKPELALSKPRDARLLPRLPFDRQGSDRRPSSKSSLVFSASDAADLGARDTERPVSFGSVHPHRVSRYDPEGESDYDLLGTYAEVVDENGMRRK
ncbi:putative membrane protein [Escovopsis weberi]|uniref:Putative membrane protein n=1 Tax=Escovopsis weberi TaxID=150374 RepID=A0A0M8MVZ5_ESCWE|nr:putative membrane protein [Escovopsis weberi]